MSLQRLASHNRPLKVSFEFFPPRTAEMEEQLWHAIRRLEPLAPAFVSVTYGAGGSTRERTHATVERIVKETALTPAAHLTCVGASRDEIDDIAQSYWNIGVRHMVLLRGDMPDESSYAPHTAGHASTPEMIAGIRRIAPFEISVSAYPDCHPDSPSLDHDMELLRAKVEAGATRAITQFGFDSGVIARFRDLVRRRGIGVPIIPGIMPSTNIKGVRRMAAKAGVRIPEWLGRVYEGLEDDPESRKLIAAAVLAEQVEELLAEGFDQFHFYTLNQADLTYAACRLLGIHPVALSAEAAA
ncbi:MAG: methylenetetrahydrofolate reductase [NAD(P)H] [Alphaproteobacteria bacterium]|nr:methylenetetrahydrofolate reductase [NAD(P)H] [Alphaproteobacteria bacterium]